MIQSTNSTVKDTPQGADFRDLASQDAFTEILRAGAQKMLKAAIEQEVLDYIHDRSDVLDENGGGWLFVMVAAREGDSHGSRPGRCLPASRA